nr:hypothetical protein [Tanacetum cinerariifolium]
TSAPIAATAPMVLLDSTFTATVAAPRPLGAASTAASLSAPATRAVAPRPVAPLSQQKSALRLPALSKLLIAKPETRLTTHDFIYPVFLIEGENQKLEVKSMPGVYRYSADRIIDEIGAAVDLGHPNGHGHRHRRPLHAGRRAYQGCRAGIQLCRLRDPGAPSINQSDAPQRGAARRQPVAKRGSGDRVRLAGTPQSGVGQRQHGIGRARTAYAATARPDNASYTNVRRFLNEGQLPPRDAVRVEEMLNYFHYQLPAPPATSPDPVRISAELSECPWAPGHQLARIGIQAKNIETASLPPANLVFLVDVSGSMEGADRLGLVQAGLRLLVKQLRPQDHVALVAYAGAAGLVLPPTAGAQQEVILAYSVARQYFKKEGNNRVLLATDGDFNVGESSDEAMEQLIVQQRETGVFLTVLGVGRGNLRDSRMETLADKGNGNYAYLDNLDEARR